MTPSSPPTENPAGATSRMPRYARAQVWRRWPVAAGILLLLVLAFVALSRRGHGGNSAEAKEASGRTEDAKDATRREREGTDSVVTLDSTSLQLIDIELARAGAAGIGGLVANGTITFDANHVSVVAPRAEGRVTDVRSDLGARVGVGTVLAIIESREVGQTRGDLEKARASLEVAQTNYEREKRLYEQSISSQKEMLEAQGAYKTALAEYNSAAAQISGLGAQAGQGGSYPLTSPLSGTVVERNAMRGQVVGPSSNLFTVADLRRVWITVDVYEGDVARVRQGAVAVISPRALPGETFSGHVTYAGGVVDTASRTLKVRVEVENPSLRLRPGMFAQVRIETPASARGAGSESIVVPELAAQELNGKTVVFVPLGVPGRFVARRVVVGPRIGDGFVTITQGLRAGDTVVAKGAFQLRAELLKGSFAEDEK